MNNNKIQIKHLRSCDSVFKFRETIVILPEFVTGFMNGGEFAIEFMNGGEFATGFVNGGEYATGFMNGGDLAMK